jgi:hypothetical protein
MSTVSSVSKYFQRYVGAIVVIPCACLTAGSDCGSRKRHCVRSSTSYDKDKWIVMDEPPQKI